MWRFHDFALPLLATTTLCVSGHALLITKASAGELETDGSWSLVVTADPDNVPARVAGAAVYDPVRDRMIVYGGEAASSGAHPNDLWQLSLADHHWSLIPIEGDAPYPHSGHTAVYDSLRNRLVVFGGGSNQLWMLDLVADPLRWSLVTTEGEAPIGRSHHSAIYDPVRDRIVIFGGVLYCDGCTNAVTNDVWALPLAGVPRWELLSAPSWSSEVPAFRAGHSAAYDSKRDQMLIYGGQLTEGDLWSFSFSNDTWARMGSATVTPGPLIGHASMYDAARDRLLLHGGTIDNSRGYANVWSLDLSNPTAWTLLASDGAPGRFAHMSAWDSRREQWLVFGGRESAGNDCWSFEPSGSIWRRVTPGVPLRYPEPRIFAAFAYHASGHRAIIAAGAPLDYGEPHVAWQLALGTDPGWTSLGVRSAPEGLRFVYPSWVTDGRELLLFDDSFQIGDSMTRVWSLPLDKPSAWATLETRGGSPVARMYETLLYDPIHEQIVMFGGITAIPGRPFYRDLSDLWTFSLADREWRLVAGISPVSVVFMDPENGRLIGFSQSREVFVHNLLPESSWTSLGLSRTPPPGKDAVYDSSHNRLIGIDRYEGRGWTLPLNDSLAWRYLSLTGTYPTETYGQSLAYDPEHHRVLVFGGYGDLRFGIAREWNNVWAMNLTDASTPTLAELVAIEVTSTWVRLAARGYRGQELLAIERRQVGGGWQVLGVFREEDESLIYEDRHVTPGARYSYRLAQGVWASGEIVVEVPSRTTLALSVGSSPIIGAIELELTIESGTPAALEFLDVAARRVYVRHLVGWPAGQHQLRVEESRGWKPGVYFARLTQNGRSSTRKIIALE